MTINPATRAPTSPIPPTMTLSPAEPLALAEGLEDADAESVELFVVAVDFDDFVVDPDPLAVVLPVPERTVIPVEVVALPVLVIDEVVSAAALDLGTEVVTETEDTLVVGVTIPLISL